MQAPKSQRLSLNVAAWTSLSWATVIEGVPVQLTVAFQIWSWLSGRPEPVWLTETSGAGALAGGGVAPSASAGISGAMYGSSVFMSWKTIRAAGQPDAIIWSRSNAQTPIENDPSRPNWSAVIMYACWDGHTPIFG